MKKNFKKYLSIFLSVIMIITAMPVGVYAQDEEDIINETSTENIEDVKVEYEVESKRTENSKTYLTEDGGYYQVSAAVPIHEEVNGEWEEIAEVDENIEDIADAQTLVSEIAAYAETGSNNTSGFYEDETLSLYTNGSTNPFKIAGRARTDNGIKSCIYVKPSIISDKSVFISNATLTVATGKVDTSNNKNYIEVFQLKNELTQPENAPLPYIDGIKYDKQLATSNNNYCKLDITSYAHYVSLGIYENYGLALEPFDVVQTSIEVNSIVIGIYYREIGDVDKNIESETVDLGRAGKLYINDYTCAPLIVRNDLSIYDELAQANIQTIINSAALDDNVSDGANTRINYYSVLQYASGEYYWKNCEGDYIFFVNNGSNIFSGFNSAGERYELSSSEIEDDYEHITIRYIKDKDNTTTYHFKTIGAKGYLTKIDYTFKDRNNEYTNYINISYNGTNISYIADGSGRKYQFNYTDSMLSSISVIYYENGIEKPTKINNKEIAILYSYDEENRLKSITYPDDYYISYTYDDSNRLLEVNSYENDDISSKNLKKLSLTYRNNTSRSNILSRYKITNNGKEVKTIDVSNPVGSSYNRIFKNITNNTEKIMQYNSNSNLVHYKDYNGQEYYLNYTNGELEKLIYEETDTNNIVKNGNFDSDSNWSLTEESSITSNIPLKGDGNVSNKALTFTADKYPSGVTQTVTVTPGKSYVLSCDAYCTQTLPFKYGTNDNRYFSVQVAGSANGTIIGETSFDYNIVSKWQTSKIIIDIPKTMSSVKITVNSYSMPGTCYFDDLSMYLVNDKNTANVSDTAPISSNTTFRNKYGQITDVITAVGGSNTLGKHYDYDNAHYKSLVDDEGKITYYNYDCGSGLLMSKGKNNDSTKNAQYKYSGIGALTAVEQAITNTATGETINQKVEYNYTDDVITSIYHNGVLYEYTYNAKGQVENISVKKETEEGIDTDFSVEYEYEKDNVGCVNFGNDSSITYVYDGNRITQTIYDNGKTGDENKTFIYSYEYASDGSISKMTDEVSNIVTTYSDNNCTVVKDGKTIYSKSGNKMNLFGNSFTYKFTDNTTTLKEEYSASLVGPNVNAETYIDNLKRRTGKKITNKASLEIDTHYRLTDEIQYVQTNSNRATALVSHYKTAVNKRKNRLSETYNNTRFSAEWYYNYDDEGRITEVFKKSVDNIPYALENKTSYQSDKGDLVRYYKYDESGQITFELNTEKKIAYCYSYDEGGNLASKKTYTHLSGSEYNYNYSTRAFSFNFSSYGSTKQYSYKSNGMTDYLTSYNGFPIEYDKSGNPIKYSATTSTSSFREGLSTIDSVKGTMEWNGNLLTAFTENNGDRYEYTYDGDGHRTSKIYYQDHYYDHPKSVIEYIWEGDTLIGYHTVCYGKENSENNETKFVLNWDKTIKLIYSDNKLVGASVVAGKNEATNSEWSKYFDWEQSGNYSFILDGQGNIDKIYDSSEQVVVSMTYDAYGNMTQDFTGTFVKKLTDENSTSGWFNKLVLSIIVLVYTNGMFLSIEQGFDGYIFDQETGLYYGQQRYYCPSWGRFLNASDPMTLTEDISSIYNSNLFNYCGNDPINNISKTGFNSPCTVISNTILPKITSSSTNLFSEDRSTAKSVGEISTAFDVLGLNLSTTNDSVAQSYWDEAFGKKKDIVDNSYGLNYVQSAISKNTSSVTKYSVNKTKTPYQTTESIE